MAKRAVASGDIQRIVLRYGIEAPRPIIQCLLGLAILGFSLTPLLNLRGVFESAVIERPWRFLGFYDAFVLSLSILGVWLIWSAWRRRYYLEVTTRTSTIRVFFVRQPERASAEQVLRAAGTQFGYSVEVMERVP